MPMDATEVTSTSQDKNGKIFHRYATLCDVDSIRPTDPLIQSQKFPPKSYLAVTG